MLYLIEEIDLKINKNINVLYFYSTDMIFYRRIKSILQKLQKKYKKITCYAINANNFKNLCGRFFIESVPTIVIFKDGIEVERVDGQIFQSEIDSIINNII